jgi:hypothetical protein
VCSSDLFNATLEVSRQLDEILDQPFSPSEVYEQVTLAIGYAARLRARFPGERIPGPPPFERAKQPSHVLYKLFDCFRLVQGLAERSQLRMLEFNVADTFNLEIEPTDVYNMATFLVSQIRYLWLQLDAPQLPRPVYHPGRKLPSHVYQRAGLLERQLLELTELVEANPGWLEKE